MKSIQIQQYGLSNELHLVTLPDPAPLPHQVLVRLAFAGINFIDVYQRKGWYPIPLPFVPGLEGAGEVVAVGSQVTAWKPGDRVAFAQVAGSYAEYVCARETDLVRVPNDLSLESACAAMLQGLTAYYLSHDTFALKKGQTCLVHAAAGGVGLLLTQMAAQIGAHVIGTVSTAAKAELARAAGAQDTILYTQEDFEQKTRAWVPGGIEVVYDSVGQDTFLKSLNCLKPRGMLALYGQSSGPVEPFDPQLLNQKGSLFLTRPKLGDYIRDPEEYRQKADALFNMIARKQISLSIAKVFPLKEAKTAHDLLESRQVSGKILLRTAE